MGLSDMLGNVYEENDDSFDLAHFDEVGHEDPSVTEQPPTLAAVEVTAPSDFKPEPPVQTAEVFTPEPEPEPTPTLIAPAPPIAEVAEIAEIAQIAETVPFVSEPTRPAIPIALATPAPEPSELFADLPSSFVDVPGPAAAVPAPEIAIPMQAVADIPTPPVTPAPSAPAFVGPTPQVSASPAPAPSTPDLEWANDDQLDAAFADWSPQEDEAVESLTVQKPKKKKKARKGLFARQKQPVDSEPGLELVELTDLTPDVEEPKGKQKKQKKVKQERRGLFSKKNPKDAPVDPVEAALSATEPEVDLVAAQAPSDGTPAAPVELSAADRSMGPLLNDDLLPSKKIRR